MDFQTVRGMRDLLPDVAKRKQLIEDRLRREFEAYGFEPMDTPVMENFELLAAKGGAGEAIKDEIYYFKDKSGRELGLRFDLTVPLARVIVNNPQLAKPFKRYQFGKVYRYDRPGASRYREFTQADVDIVGSSSIMADFECVALAYKVMKDLSMKFTIRIANKKLLEELCKATGVKPEQVKECMRTLDKLDKIGEKGVKQELEAKGIATEILAIIQENDVVEIGRLAKEKEGYNEVQELLDYCASGGLGEFVKFDASLARGLEYYTGNVFEIAIPEGPSVGGGGRFDKLVETYGGPPTPAVGISFGVDRLVDLRARGAGVWRTQAMVIPIGLAAGKESLKIARMLREKGLYIENDLMQRSLAKNLEYANKKGIPFVIIIGENEIKAGTLTVKDLASGKQEAFELKNLDKLKDYLEKKKE